MRILVTLLIYAFCEIRKKKCHFPCLDFLYYSSRIEGHNYPQCGVIVSKCGIITIQINMTISERKQ